MELVTILSKEEFLIITRKTILNDDVAEIIFKYYIPKFKIGQRVIRTYQSTFSYMPIPVLGPKSRCIKKQNVVISHISFHREHNEYFYGYDYFPASEGFGLESQLKALTKKQENMTHFQLPNQMAVF